MKNAKHSKETLDKIGKVLVKSDVVSAEEIESIVSQPFLFARIRSEMTAVPARQSRFPRYAYAGSAMAILLAITVGSLSLFRRTAETEISSLPPVQVPAALPAAARPENLPPLRQGSDPSPGRAAFRETAAPQRIAARQASFTPARRETPAVQAKPETADFYPINYAGVADDNVAGGHIVRVEMPRSSLFSLGVNVPLENDSETVKADLLVGSDGVTRAIRVVK